MNRHQRNEIDEEESESPEYREYDDFSEDSDDESDDELEDLRIKTKIPVKRVIMTPLGGFGLFLFGILIVVGLIAQIAVTRIASENAQLQKQYNTAFEEQARLKLDFERTFDLTEIEREAKAIMGMRAATELQVIYIGAKSSDHVIILKEGTVDRGILGKISDILRNLSEYFK